MREAPLRFKAEIGDWTGADVVLLYEELDIGQEIDGGEEDDMIEVAALVLGPPKGPWSFTAGRQFLPFGLIETNLISDPSILNSAK